MITALWEDRRYVAITAALAIGTGAAMWMSPWLALLLTLCLVFGIFGVLRPVVMVPVAFGGMLWSNAGLFDVPIVFSYQDLHQISPHIKGILPAGVGQSRLQRT